MAGDNRLVTENFLRLNFSPKTGITAGTNDLLSMDCDQVQARYNVSVLGITTTGRRCPSQNQLLPSSIYIPEIIAVPIQNPLRAYWTGADVSSDGMKMVVCAQRTIVDGRSGPIYLSLDSGVSWNEITTPSGIGVKRMWNDVCISGDGNIIYAAEKNLYGYSWAYKYIISTQTWSIMTPDSQKMYQWNDIDCSEDGQYVIVAPNSSGWALRSTDYGVTWGGVGSLSGEVGNNTEIAISDSGQYQIITSYPSTAITTGSAFKSIDYGVSFQKITEITYGINDAAISADGTKITLSTVNRNVVIMNHGDNVYNNITLPETLNWRAIAMSNNGAVQILAGVQSSFYVYNSNSNSWINSTVGLNKDWADISISADGRKRIAVTFYDTGSDPGYIYTFNI